MAQPKFMGVRNRTDQPQTLTHGGVGVDFKPGEVKILESHVAHFALTRTVIRHQKQGDQILRHLEGVRLFESLPLEEALKVAKVDEDPSIVEAREKLQQDEAAKKALKAEIIADLKKDGWQPPSAAEAPKDGEKDAPAETATRRGGRR